MTQVDQHVPILETRDLRKVYGSGQSRFEALKGIDLTIREGESVGIVGKSGSGKSTLMHLLALLDTPSAGTVFVRGQDSRRLAGKALNTMRNETFGFVFQQFFLTPGASVLENVTLPLTIRGLPAKKRNEIGMDALAALDLADKAKNRASDLSGGQKQRVVIARALVNEPKVIFADEPTGNLDSRTGDLVEEILFGLQRERGITLCVVTHDEDLAAKCDREVHIRDGLIATGEEVAA